MTKKIAIFASGRGSNAEAIMRYFRNHENISVNLIVANKSTAGVIGLAQKNNIDALVINRKSFYETKNILNILDAYSIDYLMLAGFLWLIPLYLVQAYSSHILNIHPALLPNYGGKGMYGIHVHRAVKANKDTESGITIHQVNEKYDDGDIVFQEKIAIAATDTPEEIAQKILTLEHLHYPQVIEQYILQQYKSL